MNREEEILERLGKLEKKENRRLILARIQLALTVLIAAALIAALCFILPKANDLYLQAKNALASVDLAALNRLKDLDVKTINETLSKINGAIAALQETFAPIRDFFSMGR